MDHARQATHVLETLRHTCCVSIGETKVLDLDSGVEYWCMSAVNAENTERWSAKGAGYYSTACALAELVGLELEDG